MFQYMSMTNLSMPDSQKIHLKVCDNFSSRLVGLMFQKEIQEDQAIMLVYPHASKVDSAIHMLFMNFDIAVLWLDERDTIVDRVLAKRWHLYYAPSKPACKIIEAHPVRLVDYRLLDRVQFSSCEN